MSLPSPLPLCDGSLPDRRAPARRGGERRGSPFSLLASARPDRVRSAGRRSPLDRGRGPPKRAGACDGRPPSADTGEGILSTASAPAKDSTVDGQVLVRIDGVVKHFLIRSGLLRRVVGRVHAVDGVSLEVRRGETLGIVGETGCGKSTLARCVARLLDLTAGTITFDGTDISRLSRRRMRPLRKGIQMIFQDPIGSLNARRRIGSIIGDPFAIHHISSGEERKRQVQELMRLVGLNPEHYNRFPAEFSGGQRQRIGVARALALKPKLIIADEPVSALDVSIQAQILNLLTDLQDDFGLTYIFIAHDLSVVRHISDRVAVMYLGKIVEMGDRIALYEHPLHPPPACRFHTRCWKAQEICRTIEPPLIEMAPGHQAACHFPEERRLV